MDDWRTDHPDVGRFIRQPCGSLLHVGCEAHADHIASDAMTHPAHLAWQYADATERGSPDDVVQCLVVGLLARIADQRDEDARRSRRARMVLGFFAASAMGGHRR